MGLPVITTDAVGCREAVDNGVTGMVCRVRDSSDLARCMHRMVLMTPAERQAMGRHGREKMVREFDEQIVIDRYLRAIDDALSLKPRGG
jgi:glycosyltransferase involved in cell wall biosynthesis